MYIVSFWTILHVLFVVQAKKAFHQHLSVCVVLPHMTCEALTETVCTSKATLQTPLFWAPFNQMIFCRTHDETRIIQGNRHTRLILGVLWKRVDKKIEQIFS